MDCDTRSRGTGRDANGLCLESNHPGGKIEGTVLVTADEIDPLTETGNWPTVTAKAINYDCEFERPDILQIDEKE